MNGTPERSSTPFPSAGPDQPTGSVGAQLATRVFAGAAWITLAGVSGRILSLVAAPFLTSRVAPREYGIVALVSTGISLTSTLSLCGVDMAYGRFWGGSADADLRGIERFSWRFAIGTSVLGSLIAGILWMSYVSARADLSPRLAIVIVPGILLNNIVTMASTRARFRGAYSQLALSNAVTATLSAILSVLFVWSWRADAWSLLLAMWLGLAAGTTLLGAPTLRDLRKASRLPSGETRRVIELGLSGLTTAAMYWVISASDRWFLGIYRNQTEVGLYSFASSIGLIGIVLNTALTATWFPEITRATRSEVDAAARERLGQEWARMVVMLLIVWLAVSSAGGDLIRLIAHPRFHESARYVPWIAGGIFFYGLASLANTGLWLSSDMKPAAFWWLGGGALSAAMNLALVPWGGPLGAAITACSSYAFISAGVLRSGQQSFRLNIPWGRVLGLAAVVLLSAAVMIPPWDLLPAVSLAMKLPVGAVVAAGIVYASSPDWSRRSLALLGHRWGRGA